MRAPRITRSRRRGSELVEFALVFPFFMLMFTGIMEYSWYFYQRGVVVAAARTGCETAGQGDPEQEDVGAIAAAVVFNSLAGNAGIDCESGDYDCDVIIHDLHAAPNNPPRITCEVVANYRSLTGFLGNSDDDVGSGGDYFRSYWKWAAVGRLLPRKLVGRSVSIFEESD